MELSVSSWVQFLLRFLGSPVRYGSAVRGLSSPLVGKGTQSSPTGTAAVETPGVKGEPRTHAQRRVVGAALAQPPSGVCKDHW